MQILEKLCAKYFLEKIYLNIDKFRIGVNNRYHVHISFVFKNEATHNIYRFMRIPMSLNMVLWNIAYNMIKEDSVLFPERFPSSTGKEFHKTIHKRARRFEESISKLKTFSDKMDKLWEVHHGLEHQRQLLDSKVINLN